MVAKDYDASLFDSFGCCSRHLLESHQCCVEDSLEGRFRLAESAIVATATTV
jgi:hypothetical protein